MKPPGPAKFSLNFAAPIGAPAVEQVPEAIEVYSVGRFGGLGFAGLAVRWVCGFAGELVTPGVHVSRAAHCRGSLSGSFRGGFCHRSLLWLCKFCLAAAGRAAARSNRSTDHSQGSGH
jgi:hypothetical protein